MKSMTGYAASSFQWQEQLFHIELRSVNNRFLDVKIRLPWINSEIESLVSSTIRKALFRGRVDVSIWEKSTTCSSQGLQLNKPFAQDLAIVLPLYYQARLHRL